MEARMLDRKYSVYSPACYVRVRQDSISIRRKTITTIYRKVKFLYKITCLDN